MAGYATPAGAEATAGVVNGAVSQRPRRGYWRQRRHVPLVAARTNGKAAHDHRRVQFVVAIAAAILCAQPRIVAAQSQTRVPLFQPWQWSCTDISQRLHAISKACGQTSAKCSVGCASVLLPLVNNATCGPALNALADVSGTDTVRDGKATALRRFADECRRQLVLNITAFKARGCSVDTSKIFAVPSSRGISATMIRTSGQIGQRILFGTVDPGPVETCPRASFNKKVAAMKTQCCAQQANCTSGPPTNCSFDCAQFFLGFFRDCSSFIKSADATHYAAYSAFAETCKQLPTMLMVAAISEAKCTDGGWGCSKYYTNATWCSELPTGSERVEITTLAATLSDDAATLGSSDIGAWLNGDAPANIAGAGTTKLTVPKSLVLVCQSEIGMPITSKPKCNMPVGIEVSKAAALVMVLIIMRNLYQQNGGAVHMSSNTSASFVGNVFSANRAGLDGGAILMSKNTVASFVDTVFSGNSAASGGAIYMNYYAVASFVDTVFNGNRNTQGPYYGGAAVYVNSHAVASFVGTVFSGNSAKGYGGAVYIQGGYASFVNTMFSGNSATDYAAPPGGGGGICAWPSSNLTLDNVSFTKNKPDQFYCKRAYRLGQVVQARTSYRC